MGKISEIKKDKIILPGAIDLSEFETDIIDSVPEQQHKLNPTPKVFLALEDLLKNKIEVEKFHSKTVTIRKEYHEVLFELSFRSRIPAQTILDNLLEQFFDTNGAQSMTNQINDFCYSRVKNKLKK